MTKSETSIVSISRWENPTYTALIHGTLWLIGSSLSGIYFITLKKAGQARSAW
jgi:hypothetical protein